MTAKSISRLFELFIVESTNLSSRALRQDFTAFSHPFICRQSGPNPDFNTIVFGLTDRQIQEQHLTDLSFLTATEARDRPGIV